MGQQKNFTIRNGLEVNTNLIFANTDSNKVGIATTVVNYTLHVNGGIGVTDLSVTGVSTFNNLNLNGSISIGGTIGKEGQSLVSTGAGVTWSKIAKSSAVYTADVGQSTFNFNYEIGTVEVYVNGVRLSPNEFTATDGSTVVLVDSCFGGETVEIVGSIFDNAVINGWTGTSEGTLYRLSNVGIGTTNPTSKLSVTGDALISGVVTATYFVGDGSGLTNVPGDGASQWVSTTAGIHTLSNVGIGTTNPTSKLTVDGDVYSSGIITATQGFISIGNTTPIQITLVGNQLNFVAVGIGSTTLTLF